MTRREFVELAEKRELSFTALCARFGISRKTGYKWLNRFRASGPSGLEELSRRPKTSPRKTTGVVVEAVLDLRRANPDWSAVRIREELEQQGVTPLPAASTIDLILRRQREAAQQFAVLPASVGVRRLEPNYRWLVLQGSGVRLSGGQEIVPLEVRDETTGFVLGASLSSDGGYEDQRALLEGLMRRHGLPWHVSLPLADAGRFEPVARRHTAMTVLLMQLGIAVEYSAAPDEGVTEDERTRRFLAEKLAHLPAFQRESLHLNASPPGLLEAFRLGAVGMSRDRAASFLEELRVCHNFGGHQEALQLRSPLSLYRPSAREFPTSIPEPMYPPEAEVRLVSEKGIFTFKRRLVHVGRAFAGRCIALKATTFPSRYAVVFAGQILGVFDLAEVEIDHTTSLPVVSV